MVFLLFLSLYNLLLLLLQPNLATSRICPESFQCGNHFPLEFPFSDTNNPSCGLFIVDGCNNSGFPIFHSVGSSSSFHIMQKISPNKFKVDYFRDDGLQNRNSTCVPLQNISPPNSPFISFTIPSNLTFFTCSNQTFDPQIQDYFQNYSSFYDQDCGNSTVYYLNSTTDVSATITKENSRIPGNCGVIQLPIDSNSSERNARQLFDVLTAEFTLEWTVSEACYACYRGGGQCLQTTTNQFHCQKGNTRPTKKIIFIGGMATAVITSTLLILIVFILMKRTKTKHDHDRDIEYFLKNNRNLAPMRYKYSSIKKMTTSFSENLGRGGFGSVFKGQFPEGRLVAVKVLKESNGNGEEFMNEVASFSRTSHINSVSLLGFCFEGSKRALVYDFMPNGSLEKFIGSDAESVLGWEKLFEIALGVARGLEYLHQCCSTRILHLDIKPQNILLDKDLNPRISDFGLAKLCPNRSSIVSMLVARGTIGYIAPEVFSRNFGEVSYKSDVYSYGMLVLEMVGGRRDIDRRDVDRTSEIYFPHYIYRQLEMDAERDGDLVDTMRDDEDESQSVRRNLMIVGLWCIQTNPKDRPTMTKVVEMLEGKLGSLDVPPKPYLYSPPRISTPITYSISDYF